MRQIQSMLPRLFATLSVLVIFGLTLFPLPAHATMQLSCKGLDHRGNEYRAEYVDGVFRRIVFQRQDAPPVTSDLKYDKVNDQGQPIYRGAFLGAADLVLIDLSGGDVRPGSQVSISVDGQWNKKRGTCGVS
ncbi:MAG: hypothetical protein ACRC2J_03590 [Microcoleaceae cyanobacterium]